MPTGLEGLLLLSLLGATVVRHGAAVRWGADSGE